MKRITFCLLAIFLFSSIATSQNYLVKFEDACMDRLEYKATGNALPYIAYNVKSMPGTVLIFDVGVEKARWVSTAPVNWISCGDFTPDENTIRRINSGKAKLTVLNQNGARYQYVVVKKVTLLSHKGYVMKVVSKDAEFSLQTDQLVSGQNLATASSKSDVFVEGTLKIQCANGLILRKKDKRKTQSYKELVVIPSLGIVKKRSSSDSGFFSDVVETGLKLTTVDGKDFQDYMTVYCDNLQASYYDGAPKKPATDYSDLVPKPDSVPTGGDPCAPSTVDDIHVVQKGETLYGISKRYGISLTDLRNWNGLSGTDIISICQHLRVKEEVVPAVTQPAADGNAGSGTFPVSSHPAETTGSSWMNASDVHVVRPGETVAMLANLFGYTEMRFRKMNSLGNMERIYPGQKLRTNDCVCPTNESTAVSQPLSKSETNAGPDTTSAHMDTDLFFQPIKVHTVKRNETLFSIAKLYSTTPERIRELNGLKKNEDIKLDQRLYVQ